MTVVRKRLGEICFRRLTRTFCLFFFFFLTYGCAGFPPHPHEDSASLSDAGKETGSFFSPLGLYQKYISPIDGNRCPMYPPCSAYSREAIQKYGFVKGWIMTCDRLLRCGRDELRHAPRIIIRGEVYCHDPVSENDLRFDNPPLSGNGFTDVIPILH